MNTKLNLSFLQITSGLTNAFFNMANHNSMSFRMNVGIWPCTFITFVSLILSDLFQFISNYELGNFTMVKNNYISL